ncbi:MAG: hypothetical protein OEU63_02865 [Gammaproteobacteria bacterium]|jgi:hypothetical protein|nr:hypothetical protein [Gammaproteobacteria bacterium]
MPASGKTCRSSIPEETTVTGEGTESDLPADILDSDIESDHQEPIKEQAALQGVFSAQGFH